MALPKTEAVIGIVYNPSGRRLFPACLAGRLAHARYRCFGFLAFSALMTPSNSRFQRRGLCREYFSRRLSQLGEQRERLMIDALFWYTGLAAWMLIVFGVVSMLVVEAHDRKVLDRGERLNRR
jgi:hypothetical protein